MSSPYSPPPPLGPSWNSWGERLNAWLSLTKDKLRYLTSGESAAEDGVMVWTRDNGHAAVSLNGKYEPLAYGHNCRLQIYTTATHSAASADTAYAITWENTAYSEDISVDDTVTSRINFSRTGTYQIDFSAELLSTNSSAKSIYVWPRINGTDIPYSTIVTTVTNNGDSFVVSRSGIFEITAGDYLESMFAVTDTALTIQGSAATAFSPAAPSATISVTQLR